ncbi:TetR-like C-terminal domain-containing protein [Streptomyces griseofuscus]|uniref:TetR-like C-terminal domain-containing protein n=1 Tax=Streptomyces griseofuscus TaxID=146922 RepID=UPI003679F3E4
MDARAGVSTATLYRRWSSEDDLVIAAAAAYHETLDTQSDNGSLEGDLRAVPRAKAATLTGEGGRLMQALIGEATQNTALAEALTDAFLTPVHRRVEEAVRRAVDRGEIPPVEDIELLGDVVAGPMMSRFLLTPRRPDQVRRSPRSTPPTGCCRSSSGRWAAAIFNGGLTTPGYRRRVAWLPAAARR